MANEFQIVSAPSDAEILAKLLGKTTGLSNITLKTTGSKEAVGIFQNDPLSLGTGIVLSTGKVSDLVGANKSDTSNVSTNFSLPGTKPGGNDAITLEFSFDADANSKKLFFQYVFGSEEFLDFSGSSFNDLFTFELNGVNVAKLTDGKDANINNLTPSKDPKTFSPDYIDNLSSSNPANSIIVLDGYTKPLKFSGDLIPGATNKLVVTIQDITDSVLDSAVFLKGGTFGVVDTSTTIVTNLISLSATPYSVNENSKNNLVYTFTRSTSLQEPLTVNFTVGGTADYSTDYLISGDAKIVGKQGTVTFALGSSTATVVITPVPDAPVEPKETVSLTLATGSGYTIATQEPIIKNILDGDTVTSNLEPNGVNFLNPLVGIAENSKTDTRIKVADLVASDDQQGTNTISIAGADVNSFELDGSILYLKAGTVLDYETKKSFNLVVSVDDATIGTTPDASTNFTLDVKDINEAPTGSPTAILSDISHNTSITIAAATLLAGFSDVDAGTTLGVIDLISSNGKIVNNNAGGFTFTPSTNFYGTVNLSYGVTDGALTLADQTQSFKVLPPVITPISSSVGLLQLSQGSGTNSTLLIKKISHQSDKRDELGVFTVDDDNGTINGIAPGQSGYLEEVLKRSQVLFSVLGDDALDAPSSRIVNLTANSKVAFYLAVDSSIDDAPAASNVLFSFPTTNNTFQNAQISQTGGTTQIAWENSIGGGDRDFNDLVIQIEAANTAQLFGSTLQSGKEIFDLTSLAASASASVKFDVKREAAQNDYVGFYKIEDAAGTVLSNGTLIKPGEKGYRQAAFQARVSDYLFGENGKTFSSTKSLQGGAIYAPILIAESDNTDYKNVYTPYRLGNADGVDHIRLLGDNIFGFEDLFGGGDRDFNDIIVKATFN